MATSFVAGGGIQSKSISEFDPRTLGGCVLWLDAADSNTLFTDTSGTTLANDGGIVNRINDKSGRGNNLVTVATSPSGNVPVTGATLVRNSTSNSGYLQFGQMTGTLTATTNGTATFTGNWSANSNSITATGITGTILVGMLLSGTNIPSETYVDAYNSGTGVITTNLTISNAGSNVSVTGTANTATLNVPSKPTAGHSLFLTGAGVGSLSANTAIYFIKFASYTGTTATVALSSVNNLSNTQSVTTTSSQNITIFIGHSTYPIPNAVSPQGTNDSTHFIVFNPTQSASNSYPITIGQYSGGGLREIQLSGIAANVTVTNNNISANTSGSFRGNTLITGSFSNYIMSGWQNGSPFTTTNRDLQPATSNQFNTGVGGLLGSRANTFPAYGLFAEYIQFNRALQNDERQQVEGYLAWKWGLVQNLPTNHPYYYSKAPQSAFQPINFPSCALWLDAADTNTIITTGSNVTQWRDKSGNGNNYIQAQLGFPTYETNIQNGKQGVHIADRTQSIKSMNNIATYVSGQITVYNVLKIISGSTTTFTDFNGFNNISFSTAAGSTYSLTVANTGATGGIITTSSSSYNPINTTSIFGFTTTGGSVTLFVNGTSDGSSSGVITGTLSTNPVFNRDTAGQGDFYVLETLIYSTNLSISQRQQIEGYLAWKWGLQSNLPPAHPFTQANYFFNNTRPLTRYFNPPDIEGCRLWLDGADLSTLFTNTGGTTPADVGNVIQRWNDKSGLENNVTNSSSTVRYSTTLNSRSVLSFPSDGTILGNILTSPSLTRDANNFSAFYVCRYPTGTAHPIQAVNFDLSTGISTSITAATNASSTVLTVASSTGFQIGRYVVISGVSPVAYNQTGIISAIPSSTQITVDLSLNTAPGTYTSGGSITQLTSSHMFGHDGRSPNFNIQSVNYEAGIQSRAISSFGYTNPTLAGNTFVLGCVRQNGVFSLSTNGNTHTPVLTAFTSTGNKTSGGYSIFGGLQGLDIAEVIVYNTALTENEIQIVEGYLSWKWGIQRATEITNPSVSTSGTSLAYPTTHPYYNYPPIDVTPMTPALRLYKKSFDPSDLSPDVWLDSQDLSTIGVDSNNRVIQWSNKGIATTPQFSIPSYYGSTAGLIGPLLTTSKIGSGSNLSYLDFSTGGAFPIASANITDATTMTLTIGYPTTSYNTTSGNIAAYSISVSGGTTTTTTATINFTSNRTNVPPFPVGSFITLSGTSNTGTPNLNGTVYTVVTATPTQVTFSISGTAGTVTGGTISGSSTSPTATTQLLATVNYSTSDIQPFIAGQLVNLSGGTFDGLLNTRIINATSNSIQFLTTLSATTTITNGTITIVPPPHNIPAGRQITLAISNAQFIDGTDATYIGQTYDGSTGITCSFNGSISGTTLTVGTVTSGVVTSGMTLTGTGITGSVVTSVQTGANIWTVTNPNSISVSNITISGTTSISPIVGSGTPYIVTSQTTNTITLTLPYSISTNQRGIMRFINGCVSYGSMIPRSIQVPTSAGVSTITTVSAHGLSNGDNIQLNFISIGAINGLTAPTNPINLNGYYTVSGITSSTLNTFQITLATQSQAGGSVTYNGLGGTTIMSPTSGINTSCMVYFPVNAYCLERQANDVINTNNVTVVCVTHNITPPTRTGVFSSVQPVMFGTAQTLNANAGSDINTGPNAFTGIGRDFAIRLACFAGTAQRFSVRKNGSNSLAMFPSNGGRSSTDNNSGFRLITTSINTSGSAIEDIPAVTNSITMNGWRNELAFFNINQGNQVSTSFRIIAIQTNGTNSMTIAYTGLIIAGQNPFVANSNITISGFSTAGFNNAYTGVTSSVTAITSSAPFYGFITLTASTPAISTLPVAGTYMSTDGVGVVFPTNRTTTLSTAQIRIGADTRVVAGTGTGGLTGTDSGLSNYCYDGGISEIFIFNSILSIERRQLLEGYLAQKYRSTRNAISNYDYLGSNTVNTYNTISTPIAIGGATCSASGTTIGGLTLFLVTLTHTAGAIQYAQGQTITVSGITPVGYNGTWTLVNSSTTTVQYYVSATLATSTVAGNITAGTAQTNTFIHPYRLNPTTINSSNTLNLTSTTSTYAQNLVAWFDASNVNSLTPTDTNQTPGSIVDGNGVFRWESLGGSLGANANLTQSTTTSQPIFTVNSLNGLPGIQFNGGASTVSNIFTTPTITQQQISTYSSNNELTMFTVYRHSSIANDTFILNISNGSNTRIAIQRRQWNINQSGTSLGPTSNYSTEFLPNNNTPYINIMRRIGSTMTTRITGNNTQIVNTNNFSNLALTGTFNSIMLGDYRSGDTNTVNRFNGFIYEVILFRSALSDQAIQQVEGYLAYKWGLQGSLPNSHAYKRMSA